MSEYEKPAKLDPAFIALSESVQDAWPSLDAFWMADRVGQIHKSLHQRGFRVVSETELDSYCDFECDACLAEERKKREPVVGPVVWRSPNSTLPFRPGDHDLSDMATRQIEMHRGPEDDCTAPLMHEVVNRLVDGGVWAALEATPGFNESMRKAEAELEAGGGVRYQLIEADGLADRINEILLEWDVEYGLPFHAALAEDIAKKLGDHD